jgi:hypothetical protein
MTQRKDQNTHDDLVRAAVAFLKQNSYSDIKADLPNYAQPDKIEWTATHVEQLTALGLTAKVWEL